MGFFGIFFGGGFLERDLVEEGVVGGNVGGVVQEGDFGVVGGIKGKYGFVEFWIYQCN